MKIEELIQMLEMWKQRYDDEIKELLQKIVILKEKFGALKTVENDRKEIFEVRQKEIDQYAEYKKLKKLEEEYEPQIERSTILLQVYVIKILSNIFILLK